MIPPTPALILILLAGWSLLSVSLFDQLKTISKNWIRVFVSFLISGSFFAMIGWILFSGQVAIQIAPFANAAQMPVHYQQIGFAIIWFLLGILFSFSFNSKMMPPLRLALGLTLSFLLTAFLFSFI